MAKAGKVNKVIAKDVVLKSVTIGVHKDQITFESLSFSAEQNEVLTNIIKSEQSPEVDVTLMLPGKVDKNFPPICSSATLKSNKINKTCDAPTFDGLSFSQGQLDQLAGYVKSEAELTLTILQKQQELPLED